MSNTKLMEIFEDSFTAADMADAAAQGFRDGVASVGAVGVEAIAAEIRASLGRGATVVTRRRWAAELEALTQQPAADGGFTAADMMDAWQEGREEAQQPAAVDDAMVERAFDAWCDVADVDEWRVRNAPEALRAALTAALTAQQGGRSDD